MAGTGTDTGSKAAAAVGLDGELASMESSVMATIGGFFFFCTETTNRYVSFAVADDVIFSNT